MTWIIVGQWLEWGGFGYTLAVSLFQHCQEVKRVRKCWYMKVPSCTEWKINNAMVSFNPNCYVEVGGVYQGVQAAYRGKQRGLMYAEALERVVREY